MSLKTGSPSNSIKRRTLLQAIPAAAVVATFAPVLRAQAARGIVVQQLHCCELRVSDLARSVAFYQALFGAAVLSDFGGRTCLAIGGEGQFMALRACEAGEVPAITHIGLSIAGFDLTTQQEALRQLGFTETAAPSLSAAGLDSAMHYWVHDRSGTPELYFADARGLVVQLVDASYCGGSGAFGAVCENPRPAAEGLFRLDELNHFTAFVNDGAGANNWWQQNFGLAPQAYQGPTSPVNGVGEGAQFLMFAGPFPGGESAPANLHHASFNLKGDFSEESVLAKLTAYGLMARGENPVGPMMHYVSRRMPERGGVEGGTPEIYFTDPDGLLMQLQDPTYCGGGGYLGSECLPG
jgi:catechol 2,3-dioxygenase-like lactoylglutathione lyase family enzyme